MNRVGSDARMYVCDMTTNANNAGCELRICETTTMNSAQRAWAMQNMMMGPMSVEKSVLVVVRTIG